METFGDESVNALRDEVLKHQAPGMALNLLLRRWAASSPLPLLLLIDEIDTMIGDSLISVLRQLRAGYHLRPQRFPQTVILRDVRDYRIFSAKDPHYTTGGSAFNIKAKSLRLGDFSETEMRALLAQHTAETDLLIQWPRGGRWDPGKVSKHVIECKALRRGRGLETTIEEGLRQTVWYVDRCGAQSGHWVVFDQRPGKSGEERVFQREEIVGEIPVTVWGM